MTTPRHDHNPGPATEPGTLRCPECGTAARPVPPADWPLAGFAVRPGASHLDGTPLCPVYGPHGAQPAEPVGVPARLTTWQAVRQSWLAHPDWTAADHLAWLDGEGYDTDLLDGDPGEVIGRWLAEHRRTARLTVPPGVTGEARVYVVAGGDMVAVFDNPDAAGAQRMVMEAAGLDTIASVMTPAQWDTAREVLAAEHPHLVITDVRHDATGQTP
ncbi:hypothetical protein [Actinoplanes sp. NBRC 103695]|uniref:hypothetical protein n=1 Tax=Actinoplanes sp. NBRC 103695 TaxID=3032202 RepID=UPI0024A53044|nr:hypothetical protein [Actinoplanes sp. NBRC 103695]GLZ01905.1 hypothetical protein Acsp02_91560 [Actinoplanes sp. NBRC 103695]